MSDTIVSVRPYIIGSTRTDFIVPTPTGVQPLGLSQGYSNEIATTNADFTFTTVSGANTALFVFLTCSTAGTTLTATWDALGGSPQTMSPVDQNDSTISYYMFAVANPNVGTLTLRVSFTGTNFRVTAAAQQFSGVNQSTPFGNASHNFQNTTHYTQAVTTNAGDYAIGQGGSPTTQTPLAADNTQIAYLQDDGNAQARIALMAPGQATSTTIGFTSNSAGFLLFQWAQVVKA